MLVSSTVWVTKTHLLGRDHDMCIGGSREPKSRPAVKFETVEETELRVRKGRRFRGRGRGTQIVRVVEESAADSAQA